jgi:hypothetical protein
VGEGKVRAAKPAYVIGVFNLLLIALFFVNYMNRAYPMVGQDFAYFIPRMLDTHLHHRINGLEIQWYTPSFGGGLPAFANPQHLQFSLPQFLLFVLDPWQATVLCVALFACIGYVSCYMLLRHALALTWQGSTLGSLFFSVNGFYLNHMTVGHIGYLAYPLLPLLMISILDARVSVLLGAMCISLILASLIYGAGFYLLFIFALSIMVGLPILCLIRPGLFNLRKTLLTTALAIPLTLGMTASKIYAVQSFMRLFPREMSDHYEGNLLAGVNGVILQFSAATIINPIRFVLGKAPDDLAGILAAKTGAPYDLWELDTSLSGILLITVFVGVIFQISAMARKRQWPTAGQWMALALLASSAWIVFDLATTRGAIYEATKSLPIIRSLHVNVRFTAAFILPLVFLGAYLLDSTITRFRIKNSAFIALDLAALVSFGAYYLLSPQVHDRSFDLSTTLIAYKTVEQGERFPITKISDVKDADTFMRGASSLKPYEPVFGYWLEQFSAKTVEGNVFSRDGDFFNMTNPTSLVFPQRESTQPFERIKAADVAKLRAFVQRRQPDWNVPSVLGWLNWVAIVTVAIHAAVLFALAWRHLAARFATHQAAPDHVSQVR